MEKSVVCEMKICSLRNGNLLSRCVYSILGDPGAVSRDDTMFVVKVYCKIETSPWALSLTEPVPEAFGLPASDWPEKTFLANQRREAAG